MIRPLFYLILLAWVCASAQASPPTRDETLRIARSFCEHRWDAADKNVFHGKDRDGIEVNTPNRTDTQPEENLWSVGANTGVPYKWGGFDTPQSFDAGIKAGKAAGDIYSSDKRRLGGAAVSSHAVGIDCSGFISRCWKLEKKQSTSTLPSICKKLASPSELKTGDIMDAPGGHVILFAKWLDDAKTRALFYEASPYSKVISGSYDIAALILSGFQPMRYRGIRD
jgi:hypothetical protein